MSITKEIEYLKRDMEREKIMESHASPAWDDLRFPATAIRLAGAKPPTSTPLLGGEVLAFSDQSILGNEEYIFFDVQLSHRWKTASSLYPHVHWVGEDTTAGNVYWRLTYTWADINSAFGAATPIYVEAANVTTGTYVHTMSKFPAISGVGHSGYSGMLLCSLSRYSSNIKDTFTNKLAYLLEIDFHIEMDSLGSPTEG